jgi:hypothetical protein
MSGFARIHVVATSLPENLPHFNWQATEDLCSEVMHLRGKAEAFTRMSDTESGDDTEMEEAPRRCSC